MNTVLDFLNSPVFTWGGVPTTWAEILGFLTGAICVYLVAVNRLSNFYWGAANAAFFFILFIEAKFYADAYLQVFYLVMQVVGWLTWMGLLKGFSEKRKIQRISLGGIFAVVGAVALSTAVLRPILAEAHGSYPFFDALTTSMSLAAQLLLSLKYIENWIIWIAADLIYVPLYMTKDLYFTSLLYVIFLAICVKGMIEWQKIRDSEGEIGAPIAGTVDSDGFGKVNI
jgi:nicotinamide mononucleotide transporter